MNITSLIAWGAALAMLGAAVKGLRLDSRAFVNRVFAAGMILFALTACFIGFAWTAPTVNKFLFWYRCRFAVASISPGMFLLFSISFARSNYREQISRWKWILSLSFAFPLSLFIIFNPSFFVGAPGLTEASTLFFSIGWSGYLWHLCWLAISVLILMNLERTFRHTTGHMRWQTKFMFLGIAGIFGIKFYTYIQTLIFRGVDSGLDIVDMGIFMVGSGLILRSMFRGKPLNVSVYLSHQFLYNSFTLLIVGFYFVALGVTTWISIRFEWIKNVYIAVFLVFTAIIGIAVLQLSDRIRTKRKRFISRHFKRPRYDYQEIWASFTARTTSITQTQKLCDIIVRMISDTLEILSVSIWLVDKKEEKLNFGGSTVFTERQAKDSKLFGQGGGKLIQAMSDQTMLVDLEGREDDWVADLKETYGVNNGIKESRIRYCLPLEAAGKLIGIMTLSEKVFYEPLSFEECELVKTIADQAAASLLNLQLSERLRQAKEMEAFQSMSTFFLHDLKNLATKLSLVTQNLPVYMDDPEFRADALKTISQSVSKINTMSSRLSLLSQKLEPAFSPTDLNKLVSSTVSDLKGYVEAPISLELGKLTSISIDQDQIHKIIENLILNASEAISPDVENRQNESLIDSTLKNETNGIFVETRSRENWAEISVRDTGCGISPEYIEKSLFRPFRTTKKQGMGIGLYHCKTIVEAHGGKIEVESEEGKGTTFRVLLPFLR